MRTDLAGLVINEVVSTQDGLVEDPIELLARDDRWQLSAGEGLLFAPSHPLWLDAPGPAMVEQAHALLAQGFGVTAPFLFALFRVLDGIAPTRPRLAVALGLEEPQCRTECVSAHAIVRR